MVESAAARFMKAAIGPPPGVVHVVWQHRLKGVPKVVRIVHGFGVVNDVCR